MKYIYLFVTVLIIFTGCKSLSTNNNQPKPEVWVNIGVTKDIDIYTDTVSIKREGAVVYAREKYIYTTAESRKQYVDKIRAEYEKMKNPKKADKWNDFSYCIYYSLYECTNQRYRVLYVEDYDSAGNLILKTTSPEKNIKWFDVQPEDLRHYTFFFICDFKE